MDVKEGAYASQREALGAIKDFMLKSSLPWPNILVGSGNGGVHVYWTMDTEFENPSLKRSAAVVKRAGLNIAAGLEPVRVDR